METSDVKSIKVFLVKNPTGNFLGTVSFSIGPIAFNSWRIMNSVKGVFFAPPSQKGKNNKWFDTVRITKKEAYWTVQKALKAAYEEEVGSNGGNTEKEDDFSDDDLPF